MNKFSIVFAQLQTNNYREKRAREQKYFSILFQIRRHSTGRALKDVTGQLPNFSTPFNCSGCRSPFLGLQFRG